MSCWKATKLERCKQRVKYFFADRVGPCPQAAAVCVPKRCFRPCVALLQSVWGFQLSVLRKNDCRLQHEDQTEQSCDTAELGVSL